MPHGNFARPCPATQMTNNTPLVSIVIPAYNLGNYVGETIDSILAQDYPHVELIVLDDGSTDHTRDVLKKYAGRIYAESHPNMGQVNTLNKGWGLAKGDILGWIGADDALLPSAVSRAVACLAANPDVVLTYCDFNLIDADSKAIRRVRTPEFNYREMLVNVTCLPGPGAFFRRSAANAVGPWNSALRIMLDYEYWLRLGLVGRFKRIPEVLALYRIHAGQETFSRMDEQKAAEVVLVVSRMFENPALPRNLVAFRDKALSNAHLVSAQLHFRGGRYRLGLDSLRDAFTLCSANFFTLKMARLVANVLFNRIAHKVIWKINRLLPK
jgi:glycosyltransferase involved in cell wall biosynthesis